MKPTGDFHNFGQRVEMVEEASGVKFQKPRPVYWERLFFGKDSPLRPIFIECGVTSKHNTEFIFNLDVIVNADFSGCTGQVQRRNGLQPSLRDFFGFGVLTAYCYLLGIRDLHKENIIFSDNGLQVIDCEAVFSNIVLPHETLLFPFRDTTSEKCGSAHLSPKLPLDALNFQSFIDGYLSCCSVFLENSEKIRDAIMFQSDLQHVPIRHILRNTVDYKNWKTNKYETPLLNEEIEQLERGDIPYFVKFLGSNDLFYYSRLKELKKVRIENPELLRALVRDATPPSILLEKDGLLKKSAQGALYLHKVLCPKTAQNIIGSNFKYSANGNEIVLEWNSLTVKTKAQ